MIARQKKQPQEHEDGREEELQHGFILPTTEVETQTKRNNYADRRALPNAFALFLIAFMSFRLYFKWLSTGTVKVYCSFAVQF